MKKEPHIFHFEQGIPGFEYLQTFELIDLADDMPMKVMKSVEDEDVTLLVVDPFLFYPEYDWILSDIYKKELNITTEEDIAVWSIVTVTEDAEKATLNLMAPIVLNINEQVGKQIVLHDGVYSLRAPLIR